MVNPLLGQVNAVGFNFAPRGWSLCDGQLLPIASNTALFSLLGTTFGGDGRTTFGLPDLRGRTMIGVGTGAGLRPVGWGERGGAETVTLAVSNLPSHSHILRAKQAAGNTRVPGGMSLAGDNSGDMTYSTQPADVDMNAGSIGNTGGGQSFGIRDPFLGLYMCIALQGIYPSRS